MEQSNETNEIFEALAKAQSEFAPASKDAVNPFFKSSYATLGSVIEVINPVLGKHGLSFVQMSQIDQDGKPILVTQINHKSGQWIRGFYPIISKDFSDPQKVGSGQSYARRYALQAAFGIPVEDDDANKASTARKRNNAAEKPTSRESRPSEGHDHVALRQTITDASRFVWPWGKYQKGKALRDFSQEEQIKALDWLMKLDNPSPLHDQARECLEEILGVK